MRPARIDDQHEIMVGNGHRGMSRGTRKRDSTTAPPIKTTRSLIS